MTERLVRDMTLKVLGFKKGHAFAEFLIPSDFVVGGKPV
jgi:hypothetical protein